MKIRFVRSGGFAGIRLAINVDTASMDSEVASEIEGLVSAAGFFDLPSRGAPPGRGADRFEYRIQISSRSQGQHSVTLVEAAVPDRAQPLLARLTALAQARGHDNTRDVTGDG